MRIKNSLRFYFGVLILILMIISYFISFDVDSGANYIVQDTLLGIVILHNAFILALYILVVIVLIISGLNFKNNNMKGGKK